MKNTRKVTQLKHNMRIQNGDRNKTNVVYQVTFDNGDVYIGSTVQKLTTKISKIVDAGRAFRATNKIISRINTFAVTNENASVVVLEEVQGSKETLRGVEYSYIQDAFATNPKTLLNTYSTKN